jgi:alpha-mannosidase
VLAGPANVLQLHPDTPNRFDAWDVEPSYLARRDVVTDVGSTSHRVLDDGTAEVRVLRTDGPSHFEQVLRLAPGARRIELETEVDWQHDETLLKVAFPLAVHAGRSTAEIGYGHVHRPTHTNTPWDAARFETFAHRWLHVGEPGYGVALVSSTTYGHDVARPATGDARGSSPTTVRLTLARSPRFPDPDTDRGVHRFCYALVPGADVPTSVEEGYRANLPLRTVAGDAQEPVIVVRDGSALVEAVKLAEDRSGDVVVRLYEPYGGRSAVRLDVGFSFSAVAVTDLLEEHDDQTAALAPLDVTGREIGLTLGPFQIVTLRFTGAQA